MRWRRARRVTGLFVTLVVTLLACAQTDGSTDSLRLRFSVVRMVEPLRPDEASFTRECVQRPQKDAIRFEPPAGPVQEFQVDRDAQFHLRAVPVRIMLAEFDNGVSPPVVIARAELGSADLQVASRFREKYRWCSILVSLDDKDVWIDPNRNRWDQAIPIGAFRTEDDARSLLGRGPWPIVWEERPELKKSERYWRWRYSMDVWEYACDEERRSAIDSIDPGVAEELKGILGEIDCAAPPAIEE